jgi:hypothetical protein
MFFHRRVPKSLRERTTTTLGGDGDRRAANQLWPAFPSARGGAANKKYHFVINNDPALPA